jgi:hypothetical protein
MLSPPIPRTGPRVRLRKFRLDGLSDRRFKEAQNQALKRLESEKLAENLARYSLDINSNSD